MRKFRIRHALLALPIACIVPLAVLAVAVIVELWKTQQQQLHQSVFSTASALAAVVEENLAGSVRRMETLARDRLLAEATLREFDARARETLAGRKDWTAVNLIRAADRAQLVDTNAEFGAPLPAAAGRPHVETAIRDRLPAISGLFVQATKTPVLEIAVPVMRGERVAYVLSATLSVQVLSELLERHLRGAPGIAGIVDSDLRIIARTRVPERFIGKPLVAPLEAAVRRSPEGIGRFPEADARDTYSAWAPIGRTGWTLVLGTPAAPVDATLRRSLVLLSGVLAIVLLASVALAWYLGRRIAGDIAAAARAADALAAGEAVAPAASRLVEIDALEQALVRSATRLAAIEAERRTLLHAEMRARGEAEALATAAAAVSSSLETPRVLQQIAEAVRQATASDLVRIAVPEPDGTLAYRHLSGTRAQGYDTLRIRPGMGFVGRVMQTRRPYRTADAASDPAVAEFGLPIIQAEGVKSAMAVPILDEEGLEGVIYAARRAPVAFADRDEMMCERLAAQAAVALRNARLYRREQAAREEAERANRAKDEFLAMLGHELRNPLGAISNAVHLLRTPRADAAAALQAREIIARQAGHLARMTDDLLDASRVSTGKIALQRRPLDLAQAAAGALSALKLRAERHRIVESLQPAWVHADPVRIEQIIVNLLANALKYTPPGGTVRVACAREDQDAVLRVADDGAGMSPELAARVFDLFVQGASALDRAHGGLGIGLTLVRRLAELHGGSAEARSEGPGKGSEFIVRLPALAVTPVRTAAQDKPPVAAAAARARDILVVEDNHDARESLRRLLELDGHRVRTANDGHEGLRAALDAKPEVALIDIGLPGIDGYELARCLRAAMPNAPRPHLVALTGYGAAEDKTRALEAGFDAHLVKPVAPAALIALLARLG